MTQLQHSLVIKGQVFPMSDMVKTSLLRSCAIEKLKGEDADPSSYRLNPAYLFTAREVELLIYGDGG